MKEPKRQIKDLYLDSENLIETKRNSLREKDKIDILALQKLLDTYY